MHTQLDAHPLREPRHKKLFELLRQENLAARHVTVSVPMGARKPLPQLNADMARFVKLAGESLR